MGGVGVEEAATVGPQVLDRHLGGDRADGEGLLGHRLAVRPLSGLDEGDGGVGREGLHHPLRDQHQGEDQRQR